MYLITSVKRKKKLPYHDLESCNEAAERYLNSKPEKHYKDRELAKKMMVKEMMRNLEKNQNPIFFGSLTIKKVSLSNCIYNIAVGIYNLFR